MTSNTNAPYVKKETPKGLTNLRANKGAKRVMCDNCKCERYGPCGCERKGEKKASPATA